MKTVVIAGITGKTGYWFYRKLREKSDVLSDYHFRIATRTKFECDSDNGELSIETCKGSILDEVFCNSFCNGADILINIAGIRQSYPLLEVAAQCGVKRFILVHTTGMFSKYKKAAKPYIGLEAAIRQLAEDNGIALTILRPTMIYGTLDDKNVSKLIKMVDKLKFFPVINGAKYELQPVHAKDLGEAYYSVFMNPEVTAGKSYNLSGGAPIMLIDMLKTISRYLGKETRFFSVPFWLAYSGACCLYALSLTKADYREKVQRMIEPRVFDHSDATADFGYAPVNFEDGVREEVEHYMSNKG